MAGKTGEEGRQTRYLLGELSERERGLIEEEYFEDDDAFEQMLAAEDELIDAYAGGGLSEGERERFEKLFLASPRGRERLKFARSLAGAVSDARPAESARSAAPTRGSSRFASLFARAAAPRLALAAVALAVVGLALWLLVERAGTRAELRRLRAEHAALVERAREIEQRAAAEQARVDELLEQLEGERTRRMFEAAREDAAPGPGRTPPDGGVTRPPRAAIASFVLTPGLVRGGGARTLAVPRGATSLALRLNAEAGAYASYRAVIETADGRQVWRADSLKPRRPARAGAALDLPAIPAGLLPPGDYALLLTGARPDGAFEGVAEYSFRVVSK